MDEKIELSIGSSDSAYLGSEENGSLSSIDVTTFEGAQKAIEIADAALEQMNHPVFNRINTEPTCIDD